MINKEKLLAKLEEERKFAVKYNFPQMALGIIQAIKVVKEMEESK